MTHINDCQSQVWYMHSDSEVGRGDEMAFGHRPVVIDGRRVGDLVSLDLKVVFYTTVRALAALDGKIFDNETAAESEIRKMMVSGKAA